MKITICSHCGHPLPDSGVRGVLTVQQRRLFDIVMRAGQAGITTPEIMSLLYGDDPDGGPDSLHIVSVLALQIRKRIEPFGITIVGRSGNGSGYYILPFYRKAAFMRETAAERKWKKRRPYKVSPQPNVV
jgi:hypothetical protein